MKIENKIKDNLSFLKEKYAPHNILNNYKYTLCDNVALLDNNDFPTYELYNAMESVYEGRKANQFSLEDVENNIVSIYFKVIGNSLFGGLYDRKNKEFLTYICFMSDIDYVELTSMEYIYSPHYSFFKKLKAKIEEVH